MEARRKLTTPAESRGLTRRQIVEMQQPRLIAAAADAMATGGYGALTVAAVIERARVSRKTFYDVFANRHECFGAVFEHISDRAISVASAAYATEDGWLAGTRSGLGGLLCLIDEEPVLARIWFVDALAGSSEVLDRRARMMARMADAVDLGRSLTSGSRQASHLTAEATVGAVSHIIHSRIVAEARAPFVTLTGPLMYMITLPYLGEVRARHELRRVTPRQAPPRVAPKKLSLQRPSVEESLRGMQIRLTYRTITTLGAIFEQPGVNNLEVSVRSGIKDQGQMSKLLSRLKGLGLIENRGAGAPNAWYTTERGSGLVRATNAPRTLATPRRVVAQAAEGKSKRRPGHD